LKKLTGGDKKKTPAKRDARPGRLLVGFLWLQITLKYLVAGMIPQIAGYSQHILPTLKIVNQNTSPFGQLGVAAVQSFTSNPKRIIQNTLQRRFTYNALFFFGQIHSMDS
jgi:hypothetical protein